jgi:hypothetical protein
LTTPAEPKLVGGTFVAIAASEEAAGLSNRRRRDYGKRMTVNSTRLLAILTAIVGAAALRLVPHPPNFAPIAGMALFSGAQLGRRPLAFVAPLGAMVLSDAVIGFHTGVPFVYASVALIVLLGSIALSRVTVLRLAGAAIASSVLFFVVTNFGTWLLSGMYPLTASGLTACFVAAIPFFQNTVAGDLFYSGVLFGGFALLERALPILRAGGEPRPA